MHVSEPGLHSRSLGLGASRSERIRHARSAEQLPFLLLRVALFLFHVGVYARRAALAYLAKASVRRLSYAGMVVGRRSWSRLVFHCAEFT